MVVEVGLEQDAAGEQVKLRRLDTLYRDRHINYLKIDTEGSDLEILEGADQLLTDHRIDVMELEAGIQRTSTSKRLVPFVDFMDHLEPYGYYLFGFYEQTFDWPRGLLRLRRSNLLFVSGSALEVNRFSSGYEDRVEEIDGSGFEPAASVLGRRKAKASP
jgi:methyltransferase FkbM-like protein